MNNSIEIFKNDSFGEVRVAGTSEQPLFCLADVCKAVELTNPSSVKARLDKEDVQLLDLHALNYTEGIGNSKANFVTESGFYDVILQSSSPKVKPFRKWITNEVIPSIRKTGGYSVQQNNLPQNYLEALKALVALEEEKQQLSLENRKQAEQIAEDAPRVLFSKAVETAKRSCLMAELAKILQQNGVNIGQNRLFQWMRDNGYLCSKGQYYNQPTQKAMELGLFEIKQTTINKPDGTVLVSTTTKVTGKGQLYYVNGFLVGKFSI